MSILKASILALGNLKTAYVGEYRSKNKEYHRIKEDIENLRIPSTRDDRENLKKDRTNAVDLYRTAFEKKETCNG